MVLKIILEITLTKFNEKDEAFQGSYRVTEGLTGAKSSNGASQLRAVTAFEFNSARSRAMFAI